MVEFICLLVIIAFAFGQWHLAAVNGWLWFLENDDGDQQFWSFDTFMSSLLPPLALLLCAAELYFIFKI